MADMRLESSSLRDLLVSGGVLFVVAVIVGSMVNSGWQRDVIPLAAGIVMGMMTRMTLTWYRKTHDLHQGHHSANE